MEYSPEGYRPLDPSAQHVKSSTTAMVFGIIGLAVFILPIANIAGLVFAIIALTNANKNRTFAADNGLTENTRNNAGRVLGIIGIVLNSMSILISFLIIVCVFVFAIAFVSSDMIGVIPDVIASIEPMIESALTVL